MRFFYFMAIAMVLAACSTGPTKGCASTDWHALGQADGMRGTLARAEVPALNACEARRGGDRIAYQAGHHLGLQSYCSDNNGYAIGFSGEDYPAACTRHNESGFRTAYKLGASHHRLQVAQDHAHARLTQAHEELLIISTEKEALLDLPANKLNKRQAERLALLSSAEKLLTETTIPRMEQESARSEQAVMAEQVRSLGAPIPGAEKRRPAIASAPSY